MNVNLLLRNLNNYFVVVIFFINSFELVIKLINRVGEDRKYLLLNRFNIQ